LSVGDPQNNSLRNDKVKARIKERPKSNCMSVDIIFDLVFMATLFGGAIFFVMKKWRDKAKS